MANRNSDPHKNVVEPDVINRKLEAPRESRKRAHSAMCDENSDDDEDELSGSEGSSSEYDSEDIDTIRSSVVE